MTTSPICVDASLVLKLLLTDELNAEVDSLFSRWAQDSTTVIGPPLLYAEVPSVLREAVYFGRINPEEGERSFEAFCELDIAISNRADLHILAWALAKEHRQPRIYDSMYLAVARSEECDFWTGDLRLANAVNAPWVKWVGAYQG